jgi:hypothetical protein
MTSCTSILPLVEKLSDQEATAGERAAVSAHLETCASCRFHAEFLASLLKRAREVPFPEPPPSYWERLPLRVLDRIDSEGKRPGFGGIWLWAPAAAVLLVAALSLTLLREAPPSPATPPAPRAEASGPVAAPPMARDEAPPELERKELLRAAERDEPPVPAAAAAPAETFTTPSSAENSAEVAVKEESASERARARSGPAAVGSAPGGDCDSLRRQAGARGRDLDTQYLLALCSLERFERQGTEKRREQAIEDAEAFLAIEKEGPRAEEIREKLRRIRPD